MDNRENDVVLAFLLFFQHPVAQLEGCKYGDGLGGAKTFVAPLQVADFHAGKLGEAVVGLLQDAHGDFDGAGTWDAGTDQDGQEFAVGKALFAGGEHFFTWAVFFRTLGDG